MNARFYLPGVGRFASADTIVPNSSNPQAFNRYSYVYNNPLNLVDLNGHEPTTYNIGLHQFSLFNQAIKDYHKILDDFNTNANSYNLGWQVGGATGTGISVAGLFMAFFPPSIPAVLMVGAVGAGAGYILGDVYSEAEISANKELLDDLQPLVNFLNQHIIEAQEPDENGVVQKYITFVEGENSYKVDSIDVTFDDQTLTMKLVFWVDILDTDTPGIAPIEYQLNEENYNKLKDSFANTQDPHYNP